MIRKIKKNVIALGFVSFFTDMASAMVTPLIPILIVHILNNDIQVMSQVIAITTFISYGFRIVFGYLADKYQLNRAFVITGYGLSALIKPLFYFASSWQMVATLQSSERFGKALRSASKDHIIAAYSGNNQSGKNFGFHKMMDIAGELAGAILIFILLYFLGETESIIRNIFAFTLIPGIIAFLIVIRFVEDSPRHKEKTEYTWQPQDNRLLLPLSLYFFLLFFVISQSFFVIQATELGYTIAIIPLFFILLNLTQTLTSYHIGLKIDQIGSLNMLAIASVFGLLTLLCLWSKWIWLAFFFLGLFSVTSLNAMRAYISHHAHNKATLFGIFYAGSAISGASGALLTGYLWNQFGFDFVLKVSIIGVLITSLFIYRQAFRLTKKAN